MATAGRNARGTLPALLHNPPHHRFLLPFLAQVEEGERLGETVLGQLWHDWLWGGDASARLLDECGGLNGMHLRGILLARALALVPAESGPGHACTIADLVPETSAVHLFDEKTIESFTAREVRDAMEACQLHMQALVAAEGGDAVHVLLMKLFVRFGWLASRACTEQVMDDKANCTTIPTAGSASSVHGDGAGPVLYIYTVKALRTHVDVLYVLLRAVEIVRTAVEIEVVEQDNAAAVMSGRADGVGRVGQKYVDACSEMVKSFHVESSIDEFNVMQQMFFLAPAQVLHASVCACSVQRASLTYGLVYTEAGVQPQFCGDV